jgi:triosephosphate isomerase
MIRAMRPVVVAANWKMNTTPADAGELARTIAARTRVQGVIRVICPPFVCLAAVRDALAEGDPSVAVGAQDVHHELAGAYTGDIAAPMLAGLATWVIVGHSERRRDHAETDERIGRKLARAIEAGLRPILCVGEQLADRDAGRAVEVVDRQLAGCLVDLDPASLADAGMVIAYEPVWAIGTGRNALGSDAAAMAEAIRSILARLGWAEAAGDVPVLYGGSVTAANIGEFLAEPSIDGALVGGASLKPDEMAGIVGRAGLTAAARLSAV